MVEPVQRHRVAGADPLRERGPGELGRGWPTRCGRGCPGSPPPVRPRPPAPGWPPDGLPRTAPTAAGPPPPVAAAPRCVAPSTRRSRRADVPSARRRPDSGDSTSPGPSRTCTRRSLTVTARKATSDGPRPTGRGWRTCRRRPCAPAPRCAAGGRMRGRGRGEQRDRPPGRRVGHLTEQALEALHDLDGGRCVDVAEQPAGQVVDASLDALAIDVTETGTRLDRDRGSTRTGTHGVAGGQGRWRCSRTRSFRCSEGLSHPAGAGRRAPRGAVMTTFPDRILPFERQHHTPGGPPSCDLRRSSNALGFRSCRS